MDLTLSCRFTSPLQPPTRVVSGNLPRALETNPQQNSFVSTAVAVLQMQRRRRRSSLPPPTRQRCPSRIGSQADLPGCLCLFLSSLVRTAWLWVTHHSILQVAVVQTTPTYASTSVFPLSPVHNAPTTHKPLLCRQPKPAHALLTTADLSPLLSPPSNNAIMS